jgi:hypothetical protein
MSEIVAEWRTPSLFHPAVAADVQAEDTHNIIDYTLSS